MKPTILEPISTEVFGNKITTPVSENSSNYNEYFKPYIDNIGTYAIGPYFWFIPDNTVMRMIAASDNMSQLTPYSNFDLSNWDINGLQAFADMIHPDDRGH
ncbi:MAG TPA: hypothetical protein VF677_04250, partial [Flavobacterium sp.]